MTDVRENNLRGSRADKRPLEAAHNEGAAENGAGEGGGLGRAWGTPGLCLRPESLLEPRRCLRRSTGGGPAEKCFILSRTPTVRSGSEGFHTWGGGGGGLRGSGPSDGPERGLGRRAESQRKGQGGREQERQAQRERQKEQERVTETKKQKWRLRPGSDPQRKAGEV